MRKRYIGLALLVCLAVLFSVMPMSAEASANAGTAARGDTLSKAAELLEKSDLPREKLKEIANWALEGGDESKGDDESEDSLEAAIAKQTELKGYITELEGLRADADALPQTGTEGEKKTIAAVREYFTRVCSAADDLLEAFDYELDLYNALEPFVSFEPPANTSGYVDYSLYAGQLSQVISQCQKGLKEMKVPAYLTASHGDLVKRMDEFQAFCQDFSIAVQLDDPLRLRSCINRVNRLTLMLGKYGDILVQDIDLQYEHLGERLDGSIKRLRDELTANITLLEGGQ